MYLYPRLKIIYLIATTCTFIANMILLLSVMTLNDVIREERKFDDVVIAKMDSEAVATDIAIGLLLFGFCLNMFAISIENFERYREHKIYMSYKRK